jgi:hypothetical protein
MLSGGIVCEREKGVNPASRVLLERRNSPLDAARKFLTGDRSPGSANQC